MSQTSVSAYPAAPPVLAPHSGGSLWSPGLRLMRPLPPRHKARLLLGTWGPLLAALLAALLLWQAPFAMPALDPLQAALDGPLGSPQLLRWALLSLGAAALLAAGYLTVCAWMSLTEGLDLLRRDADEQALRLRDAAAQQARALAEAHTGLRQDHAELRAAVGEMARRTVALCGMLDADSQDAERAGADLEAIRDEERHALQLMAALRARLLGLAQLCQRLGEGAGPVVPSRLGEFDALTPADAAGAEVAQCHQLSERVGGAERLNERRIDAMRLSTDRLVCRTERGLLEGQQLMLLTRQIQALQAAAQQRLEQLAACGAALAVLDAADRSTA